jgi:putative aldouronate transport system substrate-binding protein
MFKKINVLIVLSFFLISFAVYGAGNQETGTSAEGEEKVITYKIMKRAAFPDYPADGGKGRQLILEKAAEAGITGIDFEMNFIGGQSYFDKLNVLAASSQLPDAFSVDDITMRKFVQQGMLMKLDDIVKNMPNWQKKRNAEGDSYLKLNGNFYALSHTYRPEPFNGAATAGLVLRKDWLDNLNMPIPETIDELSDTLTAFTYNDPDQDGEDDTIGLGLSKAGAAGSTVLPYVYGAYGFAPDYWMLKDGRLVKGFTLPEMKEALAVLQKWHTEAVMETEFMVMDRKLTNEKMVNSIYGSYAATAFIINPNQHVHKALKAANPSAELVLMEAVKGPQGDRGIPSPNPATPSGNAVMSFSAECEKPERLAQLFDWSIDESPAGGFWLCSYGIEGQHYTYNEKTNTINLTGSNTDVYKIGLGNPVRFIQLIDRRWMNQEAKEAANLTNKHVVKNNFWGSVPAETEYTELPQLFDEYYYNIITGNKPVSAWDEFVKKYYDQGGKVIEDQVNAEYQKNN